jgi:hypothetical protein
VPARFACPRHAQHALARATVVALRLTLVLIHFNCCLVDVLRRALCRATVHSNFIFINVLRRALRRATILFKFIFINVLRRALRRATILLIYIYYSAASRASSRDDSFFSLNHNCEPHVERLFIYCIPLYGLLFFCIKCVECMCELV